MSSLREALESALAENPDDLAAHMAYADHLHDLGDPRGELIQVQLALEDTGRSTKERGELQSRELLQELQTDCLGRKLDALLARHGLYRASYRIERGWLAEIVVEEVDPKLSEALITAPEARLLRRLAIGYPQQWHDPDEPNPVLLTDSDNLRNLRVLQLGTIDGFRAEQSDPITYNARWELYQAGEPIWDWIARLPHLEELYLECLTVRTEDLFGLDTLRNLRILQVNLSTDYPLVALSRNPALANLTHLSFHPAAAHPDENEEPFLSIEHLTAIARSVNLPNLTHLRFQRSDAGDLGVRVLIESGLLCRLRFLDLALGEITDVGADLLIEADTSRLELLDLSNNALSPAGQRRLGIAMKKKLTLRMDRQRDEDDQSWLYDGEME